MSGDVELGGRSSGDTLARVESLRAGDAIYLPKGGRRRVLRVDTFDGLAVVVYEPGGRGQGPDGSSYGRTEAALAPQPIGSRIRVRRFAP